MLRAPVVILACGNRSRGDDALGPLVLERLQIWLDEQGLAAGFELIEDFQWQVENTLDLAGRRLALFIDAGERTPAPFVFRQEQTTDRAFSLTHALSPAALLEVLRRLGDEPPPPAFVLCVAGECFALGEEMSARARHHADRALELLKELCCAPQYGAWQARISERV